MSSFLDRLKSIGTSVAKTATGIVYPTATGVLSLVERLRELSKEEVQPAQTFRVGEGLSNVTEIKPGPRIATTQALAHGEEIKVTPTPVKTSQVTTAKQIVQKVPAIQPSFTQKVAQEVKIATGKNAPLTERLAALEVLTSPGRKVLEIGSEFLGLTPEAGEKKKKVISALATGEVYRTQDPELKRLVQEEMTNMGLMSAGIVNVGKKVLGKAPKKFVSIYLDELLQKQTAARKAETPRFVVSAYREGKKKFVDATAPIEDAIYGAQKKFGFEALPEYDIHNQIDLVKRSNAIADRFIEEKGLGSLIRTLPSQREADELSQYLIAKQVKAVAAEGKITGRDLVKDETLIAELAPKYETLAKEVNGYSRKLLDYATDEGLISKKLAEDLKIKYPDYVPLNRVFNEVELEHLASGGRSVAVASLGKQTAVQTLKGSTREIEDPLASLIQKTRVVVNQIEKNKAARIITSHVNLPGNPLGLVRLTGNLKKRTAEETISFFNKGIKEVWKADPDIARAAKSLDAVQIGTLGRILAAPVRLLKLGATGLSLPFIARNLVKDQLFTLVTSKWGAHTVNPVRFLDALFQAVGHGQGYTDLLRRGGMQTSFDISRGVSIATVAKIRSTRSFGAKIKYLAKNPSELFRSIEDVFGRSEELTRLQQFKTTELNALREGRTAKDAKILGARAARENTANFLRGGEWSPVLNSTLPYFNASIQGARTLIRALRANPIKTSAKIATTLFFPLATLTAWNLNDPKRKAAYEDIQESEKDRSLIFIPPNPTKDKKTGKWNVIAIPLTSGYSQLGIPVRKAIEQYFGLDELRAKDFAQVLIGATSPVDVDIREENIPGQIALGVTPQALKPTLESTLNVKAFPAGANIPIIPRGLEKLPPELQVKETTGATARKIGGVLNVSPLKVEQFIKSSMADVGRTLLHYSDRAIQKLENLPEEQISGQGIGKSITKSFREVYGGVKEDKFYNATDTLEVEKNALKAKYADVFLKGTDAEANAFFDALADHNIKAIDTVIEGFENGGYKPKDQKEMRSKMKSLTIEAEELKETLSK